MYHLSGLASQISQLPIPGCALNLPGITGQETCITFDAVNKAFNTALEQNGPLTQQATDKPAEEKAGELGQVILEASRILAQQYSLSKESISQGLPKIDSLRTVLNQYCPNELRAPSCEVLRYRSLSGVCNNLEHPLWGKVDTAHEVSFLNNKVFGL